MRLETSESVEKRLGTQLGDLLQDYEGPGLTIRLWDRLGVAFCTDTV